MSTAEQQEIDKYHSRSPEEFRRILAESGIPVQPSVAATVLEPNGIYVSPETKNTYLEHSSGATDTFRFEQFVTGYYQDLALTAKFYAAVFVVELPQPTVPVYINSRISFTFNSILQLPSVPILTGIDTVRLEGDFSEFFTVYSRDRHALDAFTTIVPNLMLNILEQGNQYDIEFAGRYVYFYRLYSPTYTGKSERMTTSINFSAEDYIAMREFGLKYGGKFVRAARPSTGDGPADLRPFWQLVNENQRANNRKQIRWLIGIWVYLFLFVFLWKIVMPLTIVLLALRFSQWYLRKKRLISRWNKRT